MTPDERKVAQLGMAQGTAAGRLKKAIMLRLLQRLGEDKCYRCGLKISTAEELSIEHILPWLGEDTALFWDLDNIAFSHHRCNSGARRITVNHRGGTVNRKVGPQGTAWCHQHQGFLPVEEFTKNARNWNGLEGYCRECRGEIRAVV